MTGLIGIGYEGMSSAEMVNSLQQNGVTVVVDVRQNAISRKPGFSKRGLAHALEAVGIAYVHERSLGNAKENRPGYAQADSPDGRAARMRFLDEMRRRDDAQAALSRIADLARDQKVAILCFEASELHCHRQQVIAAVNELTTSLVTV